MVRDQCDNHPIDGLQKLLSEPATKQASKTGEHKTTTEPQPASLYTLNIFLKRTDLSPNHDRLVPNPEYSTDY